MLAGKFRHGKRLFSLQRSPKNRLIQRNTKSGYGPNLISTYKRFALGRPSDTGPQFLPFADVAAANVPLSQLLWLSLFQVTGGMALVVGTLNCVMIVELKVPATLVVIMLALPLPWAAVCVTPPLCGQGHWFQCGRLQSRLRVQGCAADLRHLRCETSFDPQLGDGKNGCAVQLNDK